MHDWITNYFAAQKRALDSISPEAVQRLITLLQRTWVSGGQIFAIGNCGSAANASGFAIDLGKGASDKLFQRLQAVVDR